MKRLPPSQHRRITAREADRQLRRALLLSTARFLALYGIEGEPDAFYMKLTVRVGPNRPKVAYFPGSGKWMERSTVHQGEGMEAFVEWVMAQRRSAWMGGEATP